MIQRILLKSILLYQKTFSLDHGFLGRLMGKKVCRFYPSCSQYMYEAVERFGVLQGVRMGMRRLLKCQPFHPGGYDPVLKEKTGSSFSQKTHEERYS